MAGKLKTLFGKAAELEGRVSRRVGALGGKAKKEGDDVYSVADKAAPGGRRRARGEKGAAKSGKADEVKDLTSSGRKRIVGGAGVAGSATYLASKDDKPKKPKEKDYTKGSSKGGVSFNESFAHHREKLGAGKTFTWNGNKYTTDRADDKKTTSAKETTSSNTPAKAKKVGIIKKLLFGSDGKMGGKSGIIDNKVTRAFTKRDEENLAAGLVKKQAGGMMKSKGYARGGAVGMSKRTAPGVTGGAPRLGGTKTVPPKTRAQSRATLSPAQRRLLDSVQGREGSKQATSVIQDLSDKYGYAPGKRAGAKGGMGKGKRAKPGGMNMGGAVGMAPPKGGLQPAVTQQRGTASGLSAAQRMDLLKAAAGKIPSTMRSGPREEKLAAAKKAMAMRGAAGRRSGGSTPRGMNMGGSAMKSKMASKGGKMGGKMAPGYKNGGTVGKKSARGVGAAKRGFGRAMR
jgi:hypothetical protein